MNYRYKLIKRKVKVRDEEIEFEEKIKIDIESGEDVYDRELEIENTNKLYDIYRKKNNLCSVNDIIKIRNKYELNQSDYSLLLGFGKITIHRYENGSLQTKANDQIIKLSSDIKEMEKLMNENKEKVSEVIYLKLKNRISYLKNKENFNFNISNKKIKVYNVMEIANWFIFFNEYKREMEEEDTDYISNLKLQKLLYYAQSACLAIKGMKLFPNDIVAWKHGPVVIEVYNNYKEYGSNGIRKYDVNGIKNIDNDIVQLLTQIYKMFGKYSAWGLRNLTHSEEPWLSTEINGVISKNKMAKTYKEKYL